MVDDLGVVLVFGVLCGLFDEFLLVFVVGGVVVGYY